MGGANRSSVPQHEIAGLHIGPSEAETFWSAFLKSLGPARARRVRLVISDAHEGLRAAITRSLAGAARQRPRMHFAARTFGS